MLVIKRSLLWCFGVFVSGVARVSAESLLSDLKATAALDLVAPAYTSNKSERGFDLSVRSAELMFYSPVDHLFEGTLSFAGHTEGGEFFYELHEGYVSSSKLLPRSRVRAGKFFLGVGRLNQLHQHDWPFVSAPKSHQSFFASEAAADTGLEYVFLAPTEHFFEFAAGVTRNYCYGHCHGAGAKPPRPLFYLRPLTFFPVGNVAGVQLGLSYLNRIDSAQVQTHLAGVDLTYKKRQGKRLTWLSQTEVFYQDQGSESVTHIRQVGGYQFLQYGLSDTWLAGLRFDGFSNLSLKFLSTGGRRKDFDYALVPTLTWKPSEFSTFRMAYTYNVDTTQGSQDLESHLVELQFNFILGAHPAHDF